MEGLLVIKDKLPFKKKFSKVFEIKGDIKELLRKKHIVSIIRDNEAIIIKLPEETKKIYGTIKKFGSYTFIETFENVPPISSLKEGEMYILEKKVGHELIFKKISKEKLKLIKKLKKRKNKRNLFKFGSSIITIIPKYLIKELNIDNPKNYRIIWESENGEIKVKFEKK